MSLYIFICVAAVFILCIKYIHNGVHINKKHTIVHSRVTSICSTDLYTREFQKSQ